MKKVIVNDTEYTIYVGKDRNSIVIHEPVRAVIDFVRLKGKPELLTDAPRGAQLILQMDMQGIIDQAFD